MEPFSSKTVGGLAREMVIIIFIDYLIMNHGTIVQQNSRGSVHDEFHHFCSCLFDYEPWNHIPQGIEKRAARVTIDSISDRIGFTHRTWNHF